MKTSGEETLTVSPVRQRLRAAAERIESLNTEISAERHLRDNAIVEAYEAHEQVDRIARDAKISRARILAIVGNN